MLKALMRACYNAWAVSLVRAHLGSGGLVEAMKVNFSVPKMKVMPTLTSAPKLCTSLTYLHTPPLK